MVFALISSVLAVSVGAILLKIGNERKKNRLPIETELDQIVERDKYFDLGMEEVERMLKQ